MEGFGLLVGHMLGDYILQNDWMAAWKTAPAGYATTEETLWLDVLRGLPDRGTGHVRRLHLWLAWRPTVACSLHCLLYTLAVWLCSVWWMPWWGPAAVFAAHWPLDRWRLARWWMTTTGWQTDFVNGPLAPWSVIVVDNTFHLAVLLAVGMTTLPLK